MGKINLMGIEQGLEQVKARAEVLECTSKLENVPAHLIVPADDNPYAEEDTEDSLRELAMSIQSNGLLHPLTVNLTPVGRYVLLSGERRFRAIQKHLHWRNIPCTVYRNLSPDSAQLKLHIANLEVREYTAGQKLQRFQELETLLTRMKESGEYTGAIQKGLAELLGISSRQVRKYKAIAVKAPEELKQQVIQGELSINEASARVQEQEKKAELGSAFEAAGCPETIGEEEPEQAEPGSAFETGGCAETIGEEEPEREELSSAFERPTARPAACPHNSRERQVSSSSQVVKKLPAFSCTLDGESWPCRVLRVKDFGSHYEITVDSRSGFSFLVGKSTNGAFLCVPTFGVGCDLAEYTDSFWNRENIARYLNEPDAATIAQALKELAKTGWIG